MSEQEQTKPLGGPGRALRCDEWENLLADALDGALSAADQAAFTRHQNECALCAQMFKETDQGKAWMQYLAVEPEVPADLLGKILARTSETPIRFSTHAIRLGDARLVHGGPRCCTRTPSTSPGSPCRHRAPARTRSRAPAAGSFPSSSEPLKEPLSPSGSALFEAKISLGLISQPRIGVLRVDRSIEGA